MSHLEATLASKCKRPREGAFFIGATEESRLVYEFVWHTGCDDAVLACASGLIGSIRRLDGLGPSLGLALAPLGPLRAPNSHLQGGRIRIAASLRRRN